MVEQVLRDPTLALVSSTVQPAAVTAADAPKQESAVAACSPITSVISAAPSTVASDLRVLLLLLVLFHL